MPRMTIRQPLSAAMAATCCLLPVVAQAGKPSAIEETVVTADWLGRGDLQDLKNYSGARSIVGPEQLMGRGALNIEDAIRGVPGIQVLDETGTGVLPNIGVRGLTPLRSQRVQVLVDGYPVAIGPYSNIGLSLFPITLQSVEKIDIARGGAAVHYGPNNVGGVLNFKTKPIADELQQQLRQQLTISEERGHVFSDSYYRVGGALTDDFKLQFQGNWQRGEGFREHSETDVDNYIIDADWRLNDRHRLSAQLQHYEVEAELPGALTPEAYRDDRTQSQRPLDRYDADMQRGTLAWTYTPDDNLVFEWRNFAHKADRTFFFAQNFSGSGHWADPGLTPTDLADSPRNFKVLGSEPRVTWNLGSHRIIAGARYVREDVAFDVNRTNLGSGVVTAARDWAFDVTAWAAYISDTFTLLDNRLEMTPGVRYERLEMEFLNQLNGEASDNNTEEWLPGLNVGYHLNDETLLFANGQRSFVPVQTAQITRGGDVGNETAWNYELGVRWSRDRSLVSITVFRIDFEDQIQFNAGTSLFENLGETRHQGVELEGQYQLQQVTLRGSYTYLDTEQLTGADRGNHLANAPRHHLSLGASVELGQWQLAGDATYYSQSYSDAANTDAETANGGAGELPEYTVVNVQLGRDIQISSAVTARFALAVNNAFDEDYYFRGVDVSPVGRVPAPGRSYITSLTLDF